MRSYEVSIKGRDETSTVRALTAGKARYSFFLDASDCLPDLKMTDIKVRSLRCLVSTPAELAQVAADLFNALHPIGTPVRYWTGVREGDGRTSTTRSRAAVLSDHASVWMDGLAGCVSLSHVQPLDGELTS